MNITNASSSSHYENKAEYNVHIHQQNERDREREEERAIEKYIFN